MEDFKAKQIVHRVIDNSLSGIQDDPWMAQRVLNAAHQTQETGGFSMMRSKKKLIVLIALICIALMGTIGLAWSLSREYFADVAQITLNSGDYASWSLEEKRYMMTIMGKYGLVSEAETEKLSRQSEDEIDAFMLERYGFEPGPEGLSTISLIGIAWTEMGPYTDWDNETWVWYSKLMFEVGLWNETSDVDVYETPGEEAIAPEEALRIAEEHLISQGHDKDTVEGAWRVWHYMTHASDVNREDMTYCITFRFADGSEAYVFLTPEGTVR